MLNRAPGCLQRLVGKAALTAAYVEYDNVLVIAPASQGEEPREAELVEAYRASGNARHFEALYKLARRRVFGICLKYLRDADRAEDATHEVFLKAYEQFPALQGIHFTAWVSRIAANLCLNRIRDEANASRLLETAAPVTATQADGERLAIQAEETRMAHEVLRTLNPEQRRMLVLRYLDGYSHEQIERLTGFDTGQVRSHLQNGRRNFRIRWLDRTAGRKGERHGSG